MLKTVKKINLKIPGLRILSKVGEGGMSVVYLAEQISLKREVAVKVMRLEIASNDLDVQRFKHEAKTIARLDHPNIINIYNIGQTPKGEIFFTMPYLNHGDFSDYLLEDEQEFIGLLKSICDGLSFAHDRGVVHRDIKPENLLFDEFGNVRIADFGIAISKEGTRMTKEHQIVGSAQYMSPEQARSLNVDIFSDIYSLGIVIYERLTGDVPFDADDSISILVNHVSAEPPELPAKMRHWQNLIDKCLAKLPKDRFQSMVELKIALDNVPINSLQRTNLTIQNALSSDTGKHLKWFIPALFVIFAFFYFSNSGEQIDTTITDVVEPKVALKVESVVVEPVLENSVPLDYIYHADSELSIDEIKNELKGRQQPLASELGLTGISESLKTEQINTLLDKAFDNIEKYQFSKPVSDNAIDQLLQVLILSPENLDAIKGLETIGSKYFYLINSAVIKEDLPSASRHVQSLLQLNSRFINKKFDVQKKALLHSVEQLKITDEENSIPKIKAIKHFVALLSPDDAILLKYDALITEMTAPQKGDKLLDKLGIETILVNAKLAVTGKEISVGLYAKFAKITNRVSSKCRHKGGGGKGLFNSKTWDQPYFTQTNNHPVVCVTHADAKAYASWLSIQTGNSYRLPTAKEWLVLSSTENNNFEACKTANLTGVEAKKVRNKEDKLACDDQHKFTAPVEQFRPNKLGLYDISGNVSEWVACAGPSCARPKAMGSSWFSGKQSNKLNLSQSFNANEAFSFIGFRLIREL